MPSPRSNPARSDYETDSHSHSNDRPTNPPFVQFSANVWTERKLFPILSTERSSVPIWILCGLCGACICVCALESLCVEEHRGDATVEDRAGAEFSWRNKNNSWPGANHHLTSSCFLLHCGASFDSSNSFGSPPQLEQCWQPDWFLGSLKRCVHFDG